MPHLPKPKRPSYIPELPQRQGSGDQDFLNSGPWRSLSKTYRIENPLCENCHNKGLLTPCNVVDHTVKRPFGLELDVRNLMSLCHKCHNVKSAKEKHKAGPIVAYLDGLPVDRTEIFKILL